jgi:excisionase family DNA binding protein
MTKDLMTLDEAAKILGVTYHRAAELGRDGLIPIVRLGRQVRVDPQSLDKFISQGGKALPGGWRKS